MLENKRTIRCTKCNNLNDFKDVMSNHRLCENCDFHFRLNGRERIKLVTDYNSFHELFNDLDYNLKFEFPGLKKKLLIYQSLTGEPEAFICGTAKIIGITISIDVLFSKFIMGSMGAIVGEKLKLIINYGGENKLTLILFSASGGARMQEGIAALMQMAKVTTALNTFSKSGNLFISVLTDPTTGGVAESFAYLGDYVFAEEGGQVRSIADSLYQMIDLNTPIILLILGEGRSGGALAVSLSDGMIMMENSYFSVISPEGLAAILHNDKFMAESVSRDMKAFPVDLLYYGIADIIVNGSSDWDSIFKSLKNLILNYFLELNQDLKKDELIFKRKQKYENYM